VRSSPLAQLPAAATAWRGRVRARDTREGGGGGWCPRVAVVSSSCRPLGPDRRVGRPPRAGGRTGARGAVPCTVSAERAAGGGAPPLRPPRRPPSSPVAIRAASASGGWGGVSLGGWTAPGDGANGDAAAPCGWRRGRSPRLRQSGRGGGCGEPNGRGCAVFSRYSGAPASDRVHRCFLTSFLYIPWDQLSEVPRAEAGRCACALFNDCTCRDGAAPPGGTFGYIGTDRAADSICGGPRRRWACPAWRPSAHLEGRSSVDLANRMAKLSNSAPPEKTRTRVVTGTRARHSRQGEVRKSLHAAPAVLPLCIVAHRPPLTGRPGVAVDGKGAAAPFPSDKRIGRQPSSRVRRGRTRLPPTLPLP